MAKERKASVIYEGNASQLVYAFPFDYLRKKFVKVEDIYTNITELTIGVDYTVEDKQVQLVKGIPLGHSVKIYRETTTDPLVEWQDASVLRSADLSLQEVQLLHLAEETADNVFDSGMSTAYDNPNCWDGQYKRIINALDPIEDGDVVTLRYIKANQDSLLNKLKNTGATQNASIVATGDAHNARLTATGDTQNKRLTDTGDAQNSRLISTGDTQNSRLTTTGDSYVKTMTSLKADATTQANNATTKANEASNSAELAKKWAMSDSSPDGVSGNKSSKTWANEAKNSASSASSSASTATTKANEAKNSASSASSSAYTATTKATEASNSASAAAKSAQDAAKFDPSSYYPKTQTYNKTEVDNKVSKAHHYLSRNTAYKVGDIAYSPHLPSYLYLECTKAGTTGTTEPNMSTLSGAIVNDGTTQFSVKTVCAKEYVDLKFDHIECGVTEKIQVSSVSGNSLTIQTKYPHDTSKPVIVARAFGEYGWANLSVMFNGWIDSTHFKISVWNGFSGNGTCSFAWLCV